MSTENLELHPEVQRLRGENDLLREEVANLLTESEDLEHIIRPNLIALYQTQIGVWEMKLLKMQCQAARLKRTIELIQAALNQGRQPDMLAIEGQLDLDFLEWQQRIQEAGERIEAAQQRLQNLLPPEADRELKKIYYVLVKQLHPDLNPDLTEEQKRLWLRVQDAYEFGDLDELRILALMVDRSDVALGGSIEHLQHEQQILQTHIHRLLKEVETIESQPPLSMRRNLEDGRWVAKRQGAIQAEILEFNRRCEDLTKHINNLIRNQSDGQTFSQN